MQMILYRMNGKIENTEYRWKILPNKLICIKIQMTNYKIQIRNKTKKNSKRYRINITFIQIKKSSINILHFTSYLWKVDIV